jgi:protease IV
VSALLLTLVVVGQPAQSGQRFVSDPTEVRGLARGVSAVPFDPAAPAEVSGFELQGRGRFFDDPAARDAWALGLAAPLGPATLFGGYEWLEVSSRRFERGTVGVSGFLSRRLALGVAYRSLRSVGGRDDQWDVGALYAPSPLFSLALGVDGVNEPDVGPRRAWRIGGGVRPLWGTRYLTLGAEGRLVERADQIDVIETRVRAESEPWEGVRLTAGYLPSREELWLGVGLALWGNEVSGSSGARGGDTAGDDTVVALTLRGVPRPSAAPVIGRVVELTLRGEIIGDDAVADPRKTLSEATLTLDGLARDPGVASVRLVVGDLDVSLAEVEELRAGIKRLRESGKQVVADLVDGSEKAFMVAAAAERIRLDPSVSLTLDGFAVTLMHYAATLEKVGVRFDAVAIGKYKTAPDALTRTSARPEEREVMEAVLTQAMALLTQALTQDRKLTPEAASEVVARAAFPAKDALARGLVDELSQPLDAKELPRLDYGGERARPPAPPRDRWGPAPIVRVIPIVGAIGGGGIISGEDDVDAGAVIQALEVARHDRDVIGVVLRIDSPGGEVYASELIWRAVRVLASEKPVVASFGGVAASGGYYIATAAQSIFAEPTTITGSIGIFTLKPNTAGLIDLADVGAEVVKRGPHADWSSATRGLSDEERARVRDVLQVSYDAFVERVAAGRHLTIERAGELAQGRVYTGAQALELGLVDTAGGLPDAIAEVVRRAGFIPGADIAVEIPRRPPSLMVLLDVLARGESPGLDQALRQMVARARRLDGQALALVPWAIEVDGE